MKTMVLRNIDLCLMIGAYSSDWVNSFAFQARYIGNYVVRRVRSLRFKTRGFNAVVILGHPNPSPTCRIVPEDSLVSEVPFDLTAYEGVRPEELHEFLISMYLEGFRRCAAEHEIPIDELCSFVEDFRRGGYKNEWTHQRKLLRPTGLTASLLCSMDPDRFRLLLRLEKAGNVVLEKVVMETLPDELIFAPYFKEVVVEKGSVVVRDTFGKKALSVPLRSIKA